MKKHFLWIIVGIILALAIAIIALVGGSEGPDSGSTSTSLIAAQVTVKYTHLQIVACSMGAVRVCLFAACNPVAHFEHKKHLFERF